MSGDLVATWNLSLPDGKHKVEFEHGTTSGKRIIRVDGKEVRRVDWMFKLVGKEEFDIGTVKCLISIDACSGFAYEYTMEVGGKSLQKFRENQNKIQKCWQFALDGTSDSTRFRVVLEKSTMDVWVNGHVVNTINEFTDDGTEIHFALIGIDRTVYIRQTSSGKRKTGMVQELIVGEQVIQPALE